MFKAKFIKLVLKVLNFINDVVVAVVIFSMFVVNCITLSAELCSKKPNKCNTIIKSQNRHINRQPKSDELGKPTDWQINRQIGLVMQIFYPFRTKFIIFQWVSEDQQRGLTGYSMEKHDMLAKGVQKILVFFVVVYQPNPIIV